MLKIDMTEGKMARSNINFIRQAFDGGLEKAVVSYHEIQRDADVKLVRWVCDPSGDPLLLTRCTDEGGHKVSVLLSCFFDGVYDRWDLREVEHCDREDEYEMVASLMQGDAYTPPVQVADHGDFTTITVTI